MSLGNFLDHFDLYGQRQSKNVAEKPRNFKYKSELFAGDDDVTNYIEFKKIVEINGSPRVTRIVRVYEAYWVPESRSSFGILKTFFWFMGRVFSPFKVAFSVWRSYPAIRILSLFKMGENYSNKGVIEKIERAYRDFENWESRGDYKNGTFREFKNYLSVKYPKHESEKLVKAAINWRSSFVRLLSKHIFQIIFVTIAPVLFIYFVFLAAIGVIDLLPPIGPGDAQYELVQIGSVLAILIITSLIAMSLFRRYLFDIISWTLDSERNNQFVNRERVVHYSQRLIRKVASHKDCAGVTIVSHSLGSCIASESLLREGAREKSLARQGGETYLHKFKTLFTVGSPLDLIFFYFQADQTFSHRYNRIAEEKRLSISLPPFRFDGIAGKSKVVNFWSRFDPVSSSMHSLRKRVSERRDAIENIEVLPGSKMFPIDAHTNYFADTNVMARIYSEVMDSPLENNRVDIFFKNNKHLMSIKIMRIIFAPAVIVIMFIQWWGLAGAWSWLALIMFFILNYLVNHFFGRAMSREYQDAFGSFLHRGERGVDLRD
jgi:hypothetical protein